MKLRSLLPIVVLSATMPLFAAPVTFTGSLTGPKEEPPTASPGTGLTFVTIDPVAHTMRLQVWFDGLLGNTTASHIHVINFAGDANQSDTVGPVATTIPRFPGFPVGVTTGTYDQTFDMTLATSYNPSFLAVFGNTAAAEAGLFLGIQEGRAYLNVHSTVYAGGEIRDFLAPVPEPGSLALLAAGLAGVLFLRRRV